MLDFRLAEAAAQRIVVRQEPVDLEIQRAGIGEVGDADRPAADLVLIGRADAAPGRADPGAGIGGRILADAVELAVQPQELFTIREVGGPR